MIDINSKYLKWFGIFAAITGGFAVIVQIGGLWGNLFQKICFSYLLILSFLGILGAILERFGKVRFKYSASERRGRIFRTARNCAGVEKQIWGEVFSETYYQNYLEDGANANKKESV